MTNAIEPCNLTLTAVTEKDPKHLPELWVEYTKDLEEVTEQKLASSYFQRYLKEPKRAALEIDVNGKAVGFILINEICHFESNNKNLAEFYIHHGARRKGYGKLAALTLWEQDPGRWEISVLPKNIRALNFWQQIIRERYGINFLESVEQVEFDLINPNRWILQVDSAQHL
ncbi:MAG: hypothetical protein CMF48_07615 [Legionellales bacterium]|nr:hypothetical protein [Legionellales bacterium]|tara:strand:- start:696 stop:1208 length:513 start_codon:yes stop_codon:yes gene_type:complete